MQMINGVLCFCRPIIYLEMFPTFCVKTWNIDNGLIYIGNGCPNLRELDLYRSIEITDTGISVVAHGCPSLEMMNVSYCENITDSSLISLSNCSNLNTLECRGCPRITSLGLRAFAVRCKQIIKLDIKKCFNVNDSGMIPLAQFSHNLRQVTNFFPHILICIINIVHDTYNILDPNFVMISCNFVFVLQINLSYSSVTDVGLLYLASLGCLQSTNGRG
ncbi:hypothetical protein LXL04_000763 [Taraxacum kok-saghyz]